MGYWPRRERTSGELKREWEQMQNLARGMDETWRQTQTARKVRGLWKDESRVRGMWMDESRTLLCAREQFVFPLLWWWTLYVCVCICMNYYVWLVKKLMWSSDVWYGLVNLSWTLVMLPVKLYWCVLNLWKLVLILPKVASTTPKDLAPCHVAKATMTLASWLHGTTLGLLAPWLHRTTLALLVPFLGPLAKSKMIPYHTITSS
jgi:hypothetical protein